MRFRFAVKGAGALFFAICLSTRGAPGSAPAGPQPPSTPAKSEIDTLLNQAQIAHRNGENSTALSLTSKAIAAAPKNPQSYWVRGRIYAAQKDHRQAVTDFTRVLELEPRAAEVFQLRGFEHFKLGNFAQAIADFDTAIRFVPKQEPYHWQRGIAQYYAGRYEDGRKQFELHQTVNSNDVENAVWHFLCYSRVAGLEKARASLLPIKNDTRVPMMKVYELFAGRAKPEDVLNEAKAGSPSEAELKQRMFFAHLYLGLYYEAHNQSALAREHIGKAANEYSQDHYMGDVARVHARLLEVAR
jgi:lipoprotein NlpI